METKPLTGHNLELLQLYSMHVLRGNGALEAKLDSFIN